MLSFLLVYANRGGIPLNDPDKNVASELLASAKRAFLEEGFEGAALRKICSDAGVTTGAVYFFFHSKEELFDALVKSTVEETKRLCDKLAADEYDMKRMLDLSEKIGLYADGGFSRLLQTNNQMAKSRC